MVPLVAHIVHHFGVGGLENGLVNLINHMPPRRYRHAIVCLQGYTDFRRRIDRQEVRFHALGKRPGQDFALFPRLWRLLRQMRPDIVHTRNLSALEAQFVAASAGVGARVHGEHGRDMFDLHGQRLKYRLLRKFARPFVHHYTAVSRDLEKWLINTVGADPSRVTQIYNGVDRLRFRPPSGERKAIGPPGFLRGGEFVIGSVGRMAEVKDYPTLVRAFLGLIENAPEARKRLRLVIIGDGTSRQTCLDLLQGAGALDLAWLPGEREDIPELMRAMDVFVLPSLGEGISNTILEAMSTGLPIVATRVGGNSELVREGETGTLIPPADAASMARALLAYLSDEARTLGHGRAGRKTIETEFSIEGMVEAYGKVYDQTLARAR